MRSIWNIVRQDFRGLTGSVVGIVILVGLIVVPCLFAWFNIFSNWAPFVESATGRVPVAVASEDEG
ncbi:MAG: YhgE/Pip domain-containing protein, partial [Eubacterium sp.]|nr:YhgE/Pip domain-containing protein [Eubacterium sp.]